MFLKVIQIVIPLLMSAAGVLQTVLYFLQKKYFDSWPTVEAKIEHSWLLDQIAPDGEEMIEAIIYFSYEYAGKKYESSTPVLRGYDLFPSIDYESKLVEKYKLGEYHEARVHPGVPAAAYLEVAPLSKLSTILAPIMMCGGLGILAAYFFGLFSFVSEFM